MSESENKSIQPHAGHDHHHHHHHHDEDGVFDAEMLDPGNKALAEALRWLFVVLKFCMVLILVLFAVSGAYKVEQNEQAVVLRFGKMLGTETTRIKTSGWHWGWPYIDEVVKLPLNTAERDLNVDEFWYYLTEEQKIKGTEGIPGATLQFVRDGYNLTASKSATEIKHQDSPDYNLVHSKWRIRYSVTDQISFFDKIWDGTELGWFKVERLLRDTLCDAVIVTSASKDIEWMIWDQPKQYRLAVERQMQQRLADLNVGLTAKLELIDIKTPRQVKAAFNRAAGARSESRKLLTAATAEASEIVNQAEADRKINIAQAQAYAKTVVQSAKADAQYLDEVLGKIQAAAEEKYPDTVANYQAKRRQIFDALLKETVDQLYQETLRVVMDQANESFVLPAKTGQDFELRTQISRDPQIETPKKKASTSGSAGSTN